MNSTRRKFLGAVCALIASVYVPTSLIPIQPEKYGAYLNIDGICFGEIKNVPMDIERVKRHSYCPDLHSCNMHIECKTPGEVYNQSALRFSGNPMVMDVVVDKHMWRGDFVLVGFDCEASGTDLISTLELRSTGLISGL